MEISCNVIRDLHPLYAEDMVSEDSKKLIETHVCSCAGCKGILDGIRQQTAVPLEAEIHGMERVEENIRKRKSLSVVTAVLLTISILVSLFIYLTVPVLLTAEEAIESVTPLEDGRLKIQYTDASNGRMEWGHGSGYRVRLCYSYRYKSLFPQELPEGMNDASYGHYDIEGIATSNGEPWIVPVNEDWWYLSVHEGKVETLLYDAEACTVPPEEIELYGKFENQTPVLVGALVGAVLFGVLALLLRKYSLSRYLGYTGWLFGSYAGSMLLVTGGRMLMVSNLMLHLLYIPFLAVLYFATGIVAFKLWQSRTHA